MKSSLNHSISRIAILVVGFLLLIQFQNCSVYQSDGRKIFESNLNLSTGQGCYPYVDTNIAATLIGLTDNSLSIFKNKITNQDAYSCDFISTSFMSHINCKISNDVVSNIALLKANGMNAFPNTVSVQNYPAVRSGFVGTNHGGYVASDTGDYFITRYLAADGTETKGVICSVRLNTVDTNNPAVQTALANMAMEMAINNQE